MAEPLNRVSARITQPKSQGGSQAMLYGTGLSRTDLDKPQVGIASVWFEGNPCNMHLLDLAEKQLLEKKKRGRTFVFIPVRDLSDRLRELS